MPLRDHFRPPLEPRRSWGAVHSAWPTIIVMNLNPRLPPRYLAEPQVHLGTAIEVDIAAFSEEFTGTARSSGGGPIATEIYAPPGPTMTADLDPPDVDEYEVRVFDLNETRRLVAAVEIVSPSNKDRPETRRAFVSKCAAMLREGVCVAIVDIVTNRRFNLSAELLEFLGQPDAAEEGPIYAASLRRARYRETWRLEAWIHGLEIGKGLPTLPLWLAEDLAVPLDLESTYEETCRILRLPN